LQDRGGASWWAASLAECVGASGAWFFWGSGEILVGSRHRCGDAHGRRHSFLKGIGCTPFSMPLRVSGETLGLVRAAASTSSHPFLKVLAWYAELQCARSVVGILRRAQRLRIIIVFVDPTLWALLSFLFFHFCFSVFPCFSFGLDCAAAPASSMYRVVAILI
jgi:hypothetical protein